MEWDHPPSRYWSRRWRPTGSHSGSRPRALTQDRLLDARTITPSSSRSRNFHRSTHASFAMGTGSMVQAIADSTVVGWVLADHAPARDPTSTLTSVTARCDFGDKRATSG